jgi:hypothetical protein
MGRVGHRRNGPSPVQGPVFAGAGAVGNLFGALGPMAQSAFFAANQLGEKADALSEASQHSLGSVCVQSCTDGAAGLRYTWRYARSA